MLAGEGSRISKEKEEGERRIQELEKERSVLKERANTAEAELVQTCEVNIYYLLRNGST